MLQNNRQLVATNRLRYFYLSIFIHWYLSNKYWFRQYLGSIPPIARPGSNSSPYGCPGQWRCAIWVEKRNQMAEEFPAKKYRSTEHFIFLAKTGAKQSLYSPLYRQHSRVNFQSINQLINLSELHTILSEFMNFERPWVKTIWNPHCLLF